MGIPVVNKKSPLKQGVIFTVIMFVFSLAYHVYKQGEFNSAILLASLAGGIVGGLIYGIISYFRVKQ